MTETTRAQTGAAPVIAAITVSYFTGPALWRALDALRDAPDIDQIVLVDNGNPPEVRARLADRARGDARLTVVEPGANLGFGGGCNAGAAAARATHLLFINPDAELPPGGAGQLIEAAADAPSPWIVGARLVDLEGREQRGGRRAQLTMARALGEATGLARLFPTLRLHLECDAAPDRPTRVGAVSGACLMITADAFAQLQGFDEGYVFHVEDLDLCRRVSDAGGAVIYAPHVTVVHEGATSAVGRFHTARAKADGFSRYFRKFAAGPAAHSVAVAVSILLRAALYARAATLRTTKP